MLNSTWVYSYSSKIIIDMSQAEELAKEYEEGKGDDINPGTGGW